MWSILLVSLGIIYPSVEGLVNSTSQIYDKLEEAIKGQDAELCDELLEKHYFTDSPDESIWKYALDEVKDILSKEFSKDDHVTMEKDIKDIRQRWTLCKKDSGYRKYCEEIFTMLNDLMKDFQWGSDNYMYFRKNYVSIRVAYQSMVMLMFSSMAKSPWINTLKGVFQFLKQIDNEYNEISKHLVDFEDKLEEERPFEIGEAEVCGVRKYLWKEFEQPACEKRWHKNEILGGKDKRSVENENEGKDDQDENDSSGSGDDDDDADDEDSSGKKKKKNERFFQVFSNPKNEFVLLLGGKSSEHELTLRSQYTDLGGKKVFITGEKEINIRNTQKSEVIEELINLTIDKRDAYVTEKLKEMENYLKSTFGKVMKASKIFTNDLHGDIDKWRSKINNNKHGHTA